MIVYKRDIAKDYAVKAGISQKEALRHIEGLAELIGDYLAAGCDVKIVDFYNFSVRERKARQQYNPTTGERFIAPPYRTVVAKMSAGLRRKVRDTRE